jgi:hypothetical protein
MIENAFCKEAVKISCNKYCKALLCRAVSVNFLAKVSASQRSQKHTDTKAASESKSRQHGMTELT